MPKKHQHLTPEEKKQLKKQKKVEKQLRKEEKKRELKRDHLGREVGYGQNTVRKYEKNWRQMLIKISLPRMRQELEFAWHNFERTVDCKDFQISLLMDELKKSEEQYMRNFRTHSGNMDRLICFLADRMDELKKDYDDGLRTLEETHEADVSGVKDVSGENQDYLKTMLYQLDLAKKEQERNKRAVYYSRLDEIDVKNNLLLQKLKVVLETKHQAILEDMKQFVENYSRKIKERKKQHDLFNEQDDSMQDLIRLQFKQIRHLSETIRQLKQKYVNMKETEGSRLSDLQVERQYFFQSFLTLKAKLHADQRNDFSKLGVLSKCSAATIDSLGKLVEKGATILKLGTVCRKLETEKEQIMPFPDHAKLDSTSSKMFDVLEDGEGVVPEMALFWQRAGQVFGVHWTLKREKMFLIEENQVLIDSHNDYCERMTYPPIKEYQKKDTIARTDTNDVVKKYKMFGQNNSKQIKDNCDQ